MYVDYGMINSDYVSSYRFAVGGSIYRTGSCSQSSDARLKKDVETISGALDKVLKLRGVTFYWKSREEIAAVKGVPVDSVNCDYDDKQQIGVIAQEMEEVLPQLVHTDDKGYKAVSYDNIGPVLIEAIKELKAEKDELKAEKDALEAKVDRLEKLVEEMLKKQ